MHRIIVLSDGTWCGRETGTRSNIYELAELMGLEINNPNTEDQHILRTPTLIARYHHGVGLNSTFLDYLFNGITAQDLAAECISTYKFLVENYTPDYEIWMFGLSRGSYTVRCVAGMINNCGIIRKCRTAGETDLLCKEVYRIYRSRYAINSPHSDASKEFRKEKSWPLVGDEDSPEHRIKAPVRFMGVFDTVGGLGIPTFTGGVGLDWPEFYDNVVSSVVDQVHHLVSLHDRFYIFQPCLAIRKDGSKSGIEEEWIPGVHYDLGRQRFRFFRIGAGLVEKWLGNWSFASKVIEPNEVLADFALSKMLRAIHREDPTNTVISKAKLDEAEGRIKRDQTSGTPKTGDGDVYAKIAQYAPFGQPLWGIFTALSRMAPAIMELLLALRDRLIPDTRGNVYEFMEVDKSVSETQSLAQLARVSADRYPSQTFQSWALRGGRATH
ncbi:unnamed protein product [Clonostachys rosea f. rosea IK726]|jgi:hypothetical protein|uniref:Uncharacterized protein n=1 Tax=Clonostachys rosea f. rosea IK726 TaxID=1349383 RepID=A0ACA9TZQ1_BIOOC|nr:unnamed protein product [Clonostachys rosea f. rosea IK726]